jgi:hypothetical protein
MVCAVGLLCNVDAAVGRYAPFDGSQGNLNHAADSDAGGRTAVGRSGALSARPMGQGDVYRMIGRRAAAA